MAEQQSQQLLKFVPFTSAIESAFWVRYCRDKLETIHLNETPIPLRLTYGIAATGSSSNNYNTNNFSSSNVSTLTSPSTVTVSPRLQCHDHSLLLGLQQLSTVTTNDLVTTTNWTNNECVYVVADMIGYNTLEAFQKVDKNQLLCNYFLQRFLPKPTTDTATTGMKNDTNIDINIDHATDLHIVASLNCTLLISYADLKNHSVVYWFAMPALVPQQSIHATRVSLNNDTSVPVVVGSASSNSSNSSNSSSSSSSSSSTFLDTLHEQFHLMRRNLLLAQSSSSNDSTGLPPYFIYSRTMSCATCVPLCIESYRRICTELDVTNNNYLNDVYFGFVDPLNTDDTTGSENDTIIPYMGWSMRNMIAYLSFYLDLGGMDVHIISYRSQAIRRMNASDADANDDIKSTAAEKDNRSIVVKVRIPTKEEYIWSTNHTDESTTTATTGATSQYKVVGWELNARYKPGPRSVNLRPLLDSNHLAIQAADLNLKLMKWRMIPDLQVEQLQSTKVLLIGAGTLGCNVARVLLGWGIRHIKILDYGKVSYSNPVRQSLFTINDCNAENGGGRMKAIAAADALQTIAADVVSEGIVLSIPMPGHPDKEDVIHSAVERLDTLIQEADVVYLLTDTRESRWLPTVMCSAYNKILINAALGLDSWLVMRHGAGASTTKEKLSNVSNAGRLGCYFCSDVVAPENSTKNRTLDQQCTVTRPGLALIASSMAVELMVSLLHHPKLIEAPAPKNVNNSNTQYSPTISSNNDDVTAASSTLGIIPHSIRGSLVSYTMMTPTIPAFQYCTGCSTNVIDSYVLDKMNFVRQSCQTTDGSYLEEVSGLTAFRLAAAETLVDIEGWEDDE